LFEFNFYNLKKENMRGGSGAAVIRAANKKKKD
jgi:hypothetical protein